MDEDRNNLLARREILLGYVAVLERTGELLQVCASVDGEDPLAKPARTDPRAGRAEVCHTCRSCRPWIMLPGHTP